MNSLLADAFSYASVPDEGVSARISKDANGKVSKIRSILKKEHQIKVLTSFDLLTVSENSKSSIGVVDDIGLSYNSLFLLKSRYLLRDSNGRIVETPKGLFRRVARAVALAEKDRGAYEEIFFNLLSKLEFLPNSPTLMNAGLSNAQLSACFVLPIDDSLNSIFSTLKDAAIIHQSGGGVGFNFSHLRPQGDFVKSTQGIASGPVSFMKIYDVTTEVVKQGGKRRGANMAILNHDHPDVVDFINSKRTGSLTNFNISLGVSDSFMNKALNNEYYWLVNPHTKERVKRVKARLVFNEIVRNAWERGDPGVLFFDEINRRHVLRQKIEATNPCGEVPALSYESCTLGSVNLSLMFSNGLVDWARLERVTRLGVRFLDDIISVNHFPLEQIRSMTLANRKIGLGVMGFADLLIQLGIPYDSSSAIKLAGEIMSFINDKARDESMRLGAERGSFPNFKSSKIRFKYTSMRNATVTTIAPTGSLSIIASCSPSIEPLFSVSFTRHVLGGSHLTEFNPLFERLAIRDGFYSSDLISKGLDSDKVPANVKRIFRTALDITPEYHVRMQAAFQKFVDNAVSKTVNLPGNASLLDVYKVFMLAYKLKCKGITVYRYGSIGEQVLTVPCPSCNA